MFHLTKTYPIYLNILYAVYLTCCYTASTYGFVLEDDITSLPNKITENDGITSITFSVPIVEDFNYSFSDEQCRRRFQEILVMVISSEVPMKSYRSCTHDTVILPALFVKNIIYKSNHAEIEIIFVNNSVAHAFVLQKRPNPQI